MLEKLSGFTQSLINKPRSGAGHGWGLDRPCLFLPPPCPHWGPSPSRGTQWRTEKALTSSPLLPLPLPQLPCPQPLLKWDMLLSPPGLCTCCPLCSPRCSSQRSVCLLSPFRPLLQSLLFREAFRPLTLKQHPLSLSYHLPCCICLQSTCRSRPSPHTWIYRFIFGLSRHPLCHCAVSPGRTRRVFLLSAVSAAPRTAPGK